MPHITFIHGIANKPAPEELRRIWLNSLSSDLLGNGAGIDLGASGVSTSMKYLDYSTIAGAKEFEIETKDTVV